MRVSPGQLSLLELDEPPKEHTSKRPSRLERRSATHRDKPTENHASTRPGPRATAGGGAALLTTYEAAGLLHVHPRTVQRLVERGELSAVHLGSAVRFERRDVDELVARLKHGRRHREALAPSIRARSGASVSFADKLRSRRDEHRATQA
jgi:excisionase family DNA binding protein